MKWLRFVIVLMGMVFMAFLLHLLVYRMQFSIENASNVLFVVGIIMFLPSVIAITSAYRVFHSMRYVFRVIISPSFKQEYPTFKDFQTEKTKEIQSTIFTEFMVASLILIIAAFILARLWY
jgi:hypothetical protein